MVGQWSSAVGCGGISAQHPACFCRVVAIVFNAVHSGEAYVPEHFYRGLEVDNVDLFGQMYHFKVVRYCLSDTFYSREPAF